MVYHGKIMTNEKKNKMQLGGFFCSHYGTEMESIIHVLSDCPLTFSTWTNVIKLDMRDYFLLVILKY